MNEEKIIMCIDSCGLDAIDNDLFVVLKELENQKLLENLHL